MAKSKKADIKWMVYYENVNARRIEMFNVFDHAGFYDSCKKAAKESKEDKTAFSERIRREAMYYYWSKCEWEIVIGSLLPTAQFNPVKIDVFDQLYANWDVFIDYLWSNKESL